RKCSRSVNVRVIGDAPPSSVTVSDFNPFAPDAATHGRSPLTWAACRRKYSTLSGDANTFTAGDVPPTPGYSSHRVPSAALRSPGAPRLMPTRFTAPLTAEVPNDVHISASGMWTNASDVWFWYAQVQVRV